MESTTWAWAAAGAVGAFLLWPKAKSKVTSSPRDATSAPGATPVTPAVVTPAFVTAAQTVALPPGLTYEQYQTKIEAALPVANGPGSKNFNGNFLNIRFVNGKKEIRVPNGPNGMFPSDDAYFRQVLKEQKATWAERQKTLPKPIAGGGNYGEGGPNAPYFAEAYKTPFLPVWHPFEGNYGWTWSAFNYYGNNPGTTPGQGFDALDLLGTVGNYTLPWVPGVGTAANAALQGAVALGKGKSLKEAAMAAARGALPPYGQVAFDMAVGIANGQPVDQAAKTAALNYLETKYPGAKAAYAKGEAMAKSSGAVNGIFCYGVFAG